jgi:lipoprotein-anchoring transpeptidase ErfK/SrfK
MAGKRAALWGLAALFFGPGLAPLQVFAQALSFSGPARAALTEGHTYTLTWDADGLKTVNLLVYGDRTPVGNASRGPFVEVIKSGIPADQGTADWTVPWIDAGEFTLKVKGYDSSGRPVAAALHRFGFRPRVLENRLADGIYLDLHLRKRERLYVQRDREITRVYLTTAAIGYRWRPPGRHINKPHNHAGVFKILSKERNHWSRLFDVNMRWAMRYHGGHFIHATSRNLYDDLGHPASHGCNRLTRVDAKELYGVIPRGFRVEVIGPEG